VITDQREEVLFSCDRQQQLGFRQVGSTCACVVTELVL
jgi:hypothetical protein